MSGIEFIQSHGDTFERAMFSDVDFAQKFHLYPEVWSKCILPNRRPGTISLADVNWIEFAGRHYTTIIRCWNAWESHKNIVCQCELSIVDSTPLEYLRLHSTLFEFFCLCGSAIDNLGYTFGAKPLECMRAFEETKSRKHGENDLKWFYERRNQFIHSIIVPCFQNDGLPTIDLNLFADSKTVWESERPLDLRSVGDVIEKYWKTFVEEMTAAWSCLLGLVNKKMESVDLTHFMNTTTPIGFSGGQGLNVGLGSASGVPVNSVQLRLG